MIDRKMVGKIGRWKRKSLQGVACRLLERRGGLIGSGVVRKFGQWKRKSLQVLACRLLKRTRRRPTLPLGFPSSTIGSEELNFRVREGIGCGLLDVTTGICGCTIRANRRCFALYLDHPIRSRETNREFASVVAFGSYAGSSPELCVRGIDVCLRSMVKPHDLLVPVSSANYFASTPGLSTS